ncbi:MAG: hypothetical protein MZV70_64430 [Desulfobacterales bacterium]|nr:hypothetical protein [Desulfobacterales bacterium]
MGRSAPASAGGLRRRSSDHAPRIETGCRRAQRFASAGSDSGTASRRFAPRDRADRHLRPVDRQTDEPFRAYVGPLALLSVVFFVNFVGAHRAGAAAARHRARPAHLPRAVRVPFLHPLGRLLRRAARLGAGVLAPDPPPDDHRVDGRHGRCAAADRRRRRALVRPPGAGGRRAGGRALPAVGHGGHHGLRCRRATGARASLRTRRPPTWPSCWRRSCARRCCRCSPGPPPSAPSGSRRSRRPPPLPGGADSAPSKARRPTSGPCGRSSRGAPTGC